MTDRFKKRAAMATALALAVSLHPISVSSAEPGVLVVKLENKQYEAELKRIEPGAELIFDQTYRMEVSDLSRTLGELSEKPWVDYAEPDGILRIEKTASDPLFITGDSDLEKQWYLTRIQAPQAWDKTIGSAEVKVAVVDTGINAKHEDLNDGRIIGGYANYCQVANPSSESMCLVHISGALSPGVNSDDNGHGTIVAGILGANSNNGRGISGINWQVSIMPIKALDSTGSGRASDVAEGIRWAVDNGADIVNLSIGGPGLNGFEVVKEAVQYAFDSGVLVVAAAGNDAAVTGGNLNENPVSPVCGDTSANIILGVAAVDHEDKKTRFSNYGSNCIDISAPGAATFVDKDEKQGLVSTYYDPSRPGENNLYVFAAGTSLAAPMVSGVAALIKSIFPQYGASTLRDKLLLSVDNINAVNQSGCGGSCAGHIGAGRLNAAKAVAGNAQFPGGTIVQSGGRYYLIENGLKRPVSDFVFSQKFSQSEVTFTDPASIAALPGGPPVPPAEGTTVKEPANPTVYIIENGQKQGLTYLAFVSRNLEFKDVVTLPAEELASYQNGKNAEIADGVLIKTDSSPAVYILEKGERRLLSFFVFIQRELDKKTIVTLSAAELEQFSRNSNGFLFPPLNGTLIKGEGNPLVYLIMDGKRRALNLNAFNNRGYRFEDIHSLPVSETAGYELGDAIIE